MLEVWDWFTTTTMGIGQSNSLIVFPKHTQLDDVFPHAVLKIPWFVISVEVKYSGGVS